MIFERYCVSDVYEVGLHSMAPVEDLLQTYQERQLVEIPLMYVKQINQNESEVKHKSL